MPKSCPRPRRVHLVGAVRALEEVGNPTGPTLGQRDLEVGVLLDRLGPQQIRGGLHNVHRLQGDHHVHRRVRSGDRQPARRADVHVHHRVGVDQRLPQRRPVVVVEARIAHRGRVLGERQRVHATLGVAAHLLGARFGVPDDRQAHRDEAGRILLAPLLDVPVVVGLQQRQAEVGVLGGEQPAREAGERREADRAEDAAGVHVLDPLVDLVATGPDLVEALRLEAVLLLRPPGHRVERDIGDHHIAELPGVAAVRVVHQPRRIVDVLLLQVVLEHVRRFDDVVIDTDQDHVVLVHGAPFPVTLNGSARTVLYLGKLASRRERINLRTVLSHDNAGQMFGAGSFPAHGH